MISFLVWTLQIRNDEASVIGSAMKSGRERRWLKAFVISFSFYHVAVVIPTKLVFPLWTT